MISVIVPVYNVERYLERCVSSILAQTCGDFELLLVDDGSTDRSSEICDALALKDGRIRVFHKANGGPSEARNYGLDRMRGEYVTFVDSDDYIGPECLRLLLEMIAEADADMAIASMVSSSSESLEFTTSPDDREVFDRAAALREMIVCRRTGVSLCCKLFRQGLFDQRRLPIGEYYEDLSTTPYLLERCDRVAFSTSIQYYYYQRRGSIMHSISAQKIANWTESMDKLYAYVEKAYPDMTDCVICRYINHGFATVINNSLESEDYSRVVRTFMRAHAQWWRRALTNPYLTGKEKAKVLMFMASPRLYRLLYRAFGKGI